MNNRNRRYRSIVRRLWLFAALVGGSSSACADSFFATQVLDHTVGSSQSPAFADVLLTLGGPRGAGTVNGSTDVYNLGIGGSLTLGFDQPASPRVMQNGPGADFILFENPIYAGGNSSASFAELVFVEVSSNGTDYARFPIISNTPSPVGAFGAINPTNVSGFGGVHPVLANVDNNAIDPFDPAAAGGDAFDLDALANHSLVQSGAVDLNQIRSIRLIDVYGNGSLLDGAGHPIYDPTGSPNNGADIDAISVINGALAVNQWKGPGGGLYSTASNWSAGTVPNGATQTAIFGPTITANAAINLQAEVTLSSLRFESSFSYTLGGSGSVALRGTTSAPASVTATSGSHTVAVAMAIEGSAVISAGSGALTFSGAQNWSNGSDVEIASGVAIFELGIDAGGASLTIDDGATVVLGQREDGNSSLLLRAAATQPTLGEVTPSQIAELGAGIPNVMPMAKRETEAGGLAASFHSQAVPEPAGLISMLVVAFLFPRRRTR